MRTAYVRTADSVMQPVLHDIPWREDKLAGTAAVAHAWAQKQQDGRHRCAQSQICFTVGIW
jgi:hypothetical protein